MPVPRHLVSGLLAPKPGKKREVPDPDQGLGAGFQPPCPIALSIPQVTAAAPVAQPVWLQYRSLRPPSMGCTRGCRDDASDEGLAVWSLVQTRTRPWTWDGGGVRGRDWAPVTWDRTAQPPSMAGRPPAAPPCGPRMAVARCVRQIRGYTWPRVYGVWLKGSPVATWKTTD